MLRAGRFTPIGSATNRPADHVAMALAAAGLVVHAHLLAGVPFDSKLFSTCAACCSNLKSALTFSHTK